MTQQQQQTWQTTGASRIDDLHYSIVIKWSPDDNAFIADVPELPYTKVDGATYQEALTRILEVLELAVEGEDPVTLPMPDVIVYDHDE